MTILENPEVKGAEHANIKQAILLLGGNLGDVRNTFDNARELLREDVEIKCTSSMYRTQAWGMEAPDFLNQVVVIRTALSAIELLNLILRIETAIGRKREKNNSYESRLIDIDILFYEQEIIHLPDLSIPHPLIEKRKFALMPLIELVPDFRHPISCKTMVQLFEECEDNLEVEKL